MELKRDPHSHLNNCLMQSKLNYIHAAEIALLFKGKITDGMLLEKIDLVTIVIKIDKIMDNSLILLIIWMQSKMSE